ncbi:GYF domain-containing protein [Akkermansiaceae bacterium]|nr:GYF domain-containing protein [Akkermansiaceae bacterium]
MSEWFYGREGQQYGPIDEASMKGRIATGEVGPHDLVWKESMEKWLPLSQVSELSSGLPAASDSPYATPNSNPVAGVSPAAMPMGPSTSGLAIASLVCGILAVLASCYVVGMIFGIPAVICGHLAMKRTKNLLQPEGGKGMAIAGLICGYIGCAITLAAVIFGVVMYFKIKPEMDRAIEAEQQKFEEAIQEEAEIYEVKGQ